MINDRYTGSRGELNFEDDLVALLEKNGWRDGTFTKLTVEQEGIFDPNHITSLEGNLRNIIFENNRKELNNVRLSDSEFAQIMAEINKANTPVKAHHFINGKSVHIKRDSDSKDKDNAGKLIHLTIFEQAQIASGYTKYQIARQTQYKTSKYLNDKRGDVTLLINGLPLIHLELKARNVSIGRAYEQIKTYMGDNIFTGLMGLVQVFFTMNPDKVKYFANPGSVKAFKKVFWFKWADEKNEVINDWQTIIASNRNAMLSIPAAHELIGYYTVADKDQKVLKVLRPYQINMVHAIYARVKGHNWGELNPLGGICWCTMGGGKTLSAFVAGQLIRDLNLADKILHIADRVDLNEQAFHEYNSFSRDGEEVQETTTIYDLFVKLKSSDSKDQMIITSLQKIKEINIEELEATQKEDLDLIKSKKIVFIFDEAQRSQLGIMHEKIKNTFPTALFFGITGTPRIRESENDEHDTRNAFGEYISIYSLANGIRDMNVLGFSPRSWITYKERELRELVALQQCNARTVDEIEVGTSRHKLYLDFMEKRLMTSEYIDKKGNKIKGIEGYLPTNQYNNPKHRKAVVEHIISAFPTLSMGCYGTRFSALLKTASIPEAISYFYLFQQICPNIKVTAIFDFHISNKGIKDLDKEKAISDILKDYKEKYGIDFDRKNDPTLSSFKIDVMNRMAHKNNYTNIKDEDIIDIVIVVDQLLVGYDSQYVNTLYIDDVMDSMNLIQAISRTNRVYDEDEKPFGNIRFFRKTYTMWDNLQKALKLYCEGDTSGVIVDNVEENIEKMNDIFSYIKKLFQNNNIQNFNRLPTDELERKQFKKQFSLLRSRLNAIRLQGGLIVEKKSNLECYWDENSKTGKKLNFSSDEYNLLNIRYYDMLHINNTKNDIFKEGFNLNTYLSEIELEKIDIDYLEKHFKLIVPILVDIYALEETKDKYIAELESKVDFGKLTEQQQRYARQVLNDIRFGKLIYRDDKKFIDYISDYICTAQYKEMHNFADRYGINEQQLIDIINDKPNTDNLNYENRFTILSNSRNDDKVVEYYHCNKGMAGIKMQKDLKKFILEDIYKI